MDRIKVRDLIIKLREAGGFPLRTKGSHQTWKVGDNVIVLTVNHLNKEACVDSLRSAQKAGIKVK